MLFTRSVRLHLAAEPSLSAEDGFLQFMIERLLGQQCTGRRSRRMKNCEEVGDDMKLTSLQSITDFMTCAGRTHAGQYPTLGQKKSCGCKVS